MNKCGLTFSIATFPLKDTGYGTTDTARINYTVAQLLYFFIMHFIMCNQLQHSQLEDLITATILVDKSDTQTTFKRLYKCSILVFNISPEWTHCSTFRENHFLDHMRVAVDSSSESRLRLLLTASPRCLFSLMKTNCWWHAFIHPYSMQRQRCIAVQNSHLSLLCTHSQQLLETREVKAHWAFPLLNTY